MTTEKLTLSPAEAKVAHLVARGLPNKLIAYELAVCEATVKKHIVSIFQKLAVTNRVQIALEWHGIAWRDAA